MLKHILLITYRDFLRNKATFLINWIGLSTGLACVLLIYLWVHDELSIDKFHENDSQLYQVMTNFHGPDAIETWENTPLPLAEAFMDEFPEVESATLSNDNFLPDGNITYGENTLTAHRLVADERFFDMFSYKLLQGDSKQVLLDINSIVLSEELAIKLFQSTTNVVGKAVEWANPYWKQTFQVSGIFAKLPTNSSEQFDAVVHVDMMIDANPNSATWKQTAVKSYLTLKPGTNVDNFNEKIETYMFSKVPDRQTNRLFVQQYSRKYLYGNFENGIQAGGRIAYVKLFSIVALFLLLIACINFMNLSTAQASRKMREIGVKKAMGASRIGLILQFLGESMFMVVLSLIAAAGLAVFLLPQFNEITGKTLELDWTPELVASIAGIGLFTGLVAGSYPAFYLSGFNPVEVLKGNRSSSAAEKWIRKGLVVFQFALSVSFIVGVLVVDQQLQFTQSKNMGYNRDNIISFQRPRHNDDLDVFLAELKQIPGVQFASNMGGNILDGSADQGGFSWRGQELDKKWIFQSPQISYDVIETLGMKMVDGRSFSREYKDDQSKIIINEAAYKMMQLDDPIGKVITNGSNRLEIIGVVGDFNYGSLHHSVRPLIFNLAHWGRNIMIKMESGTERATIDQAQKVFKEFHPDYAFNFSFLDEDNQELYEAESRVSILSKYFSALAIIISCLGLFGLAAFTAEQRKKEIGIRKALGQSSMQVSFLLSSEFAQLVLIAIVIGFPVAYQLTSDWLSTFAYRIDLKIGYFLIAGIVALVVALVTVSSQAIRAAHMNPVEALRE